MDGFSSQAAVTKRLEGKVAIITGGASGIGESSARLFVKYGAKVIIADIQDDLGNALCSEIGGDSISFVHCDVTSDADIKNAVNTAMSKYGKLDIMFNNAGICGQLNPSILDLGLEEFRKVMEVNAIGGFLGAKHAARVMIPARKGCILFTASVASVIGGTSSHAYTASKHAILGLMKNLSVELGKFGIRVNCVSPYAVPTPIMAKRPLTTMEKTMMQEAISFTANLKGVYLGSEDVAEAAAFLASEESKYVSGLNLVVDGGISGTNSAAHIGGGKGNEKI